MIIFAKIMIVLYEENDGSIGDSSSYLHWKPHEGYSDEEMSSDEYDDDDTYNLQKNAKSEYDGRNYCCLYHHSTFLTNKMITLDTSHINDMSNMFCNFHNMKYVNLSSYEDTSIKDIKYSKHFGDSEYDEYDKEEEEEEEEDCSWEEVYARGTGIYKRIKKLYIPHPKLKTARLFDTSNVTDMSYMFSMLNLKHVILDINVSKVERMSNMFYANHSCRTIKFGIEKHPVDTSNLKSTERMFWNCEHLEEVDISQFNVVNVENAERMFAECKSLQELTLPFNAVNIIYTSNMFYKCHALHTLNIIVTTTEPIMSHATTTENMFAECYKLKHLDTSKFNLHNNCDVKCMFSKTHLTFVDMYGCIASELSNNLLKESQIKYVYIGYLRNNTTIDYKYDPVYGMYKHI